MTAAPLTPPPGFRAHADALRAAAVRECLRHGRPDLAGRLERYEAGGTTLVVLGDFGAGKSTLVNTLVDAPVCPVDDLRSTGVPTTVRFGQQPAEAWTAAADRILEGGSPADRVDLAVAADLLASGLTLVDAPGAGGLGSASGAAGLAALAAADGALFVTSAADELTVFEYGYLRRTLDLTATVACVLTKTDFYPNWRAVHDADVRGLGVLGIRLLAASAPLRVLARATDDPELDAESGYPAVVEYLSAVLDHHAAQEAAAVADEVAGVYDQLIAQYARRDAPVHDLAAGDAPWRRRLAAGLAALDVAADVGTRTGVVLDTAHEAMASGDPADTWPQVATRLHGGMAYAVTEHHLWRRDRLAALAEAVAEDFAAQAGTVVAHPTGQVADRYVDREPVGSPVPAPAAYDTVDGYATTLREATTAVSRAALDRFAARTAERHVRRAAELSRTATLARGATHPAAVDR